MKPGPDTIFIAILLIILAAFSSFGDEDAAQDQTAQFTVPETIVVVAPLFGRIRNDLDISFTAKIPDLSTGELDQFPLIDKEIRKNNLVDSALMAGMLTSVIMENASFVNLMYATHVNSSMILGNIFVANYYFRSKKDYLQPNAGIAFDYTMVKAGFSMDEYPFIGPLYSVNIQTQVILPMFKAGMKIHLHLEEYVDWLFGWYFEPYMIYIPEIIPISIHSPGGVIIRNPGMEPIVVEAIQTGKTNFHHLFLVGFNFKIKFWYIADLDLKFYYKIPLDKESKAGISLRCRGNINVSRHWALAFYMDYSEHLNNTNFFWLAGPAYAFY